MIYEAFYSTNKKKYSGSKNFLQITYKPLRPKNKNIYNIQ